MKLFRRCPMWAVDDLAHARDLSIPTLGYKHNLVLGLASEMSRQVSVLAGKTLMNKENSHDCC